MAVKQSAKINSLIAGDWPGGMAIVKQSIIDVFTNIVPFLVALIPAAVLLLGVLAGPHGAGIILIVLGVAGLIYSTLCLIPATPIYGLARADGRAMTTKEVYVWRWTPLWKLVVANLLLAVPIIIGFILLIIPGIIALILLVPTIALVQFIIIEEKNIGPIDAIKKAYHLSKPHRMKVWGIVGWYVLIVLAFLLVLGVIFGAFLGRAHASSLSDPHGHSSNRGGFGGGTSAFSATSFAYLYRWIGHQAKS